MSDEEKAGEEDTFRRERTSDGEDDEYSNKKSNNDNHAGSTNGGDDDNMVVERDSNGTLAEDVEEGLQSLSVELEEGTRKYLETLSHESQREVLEKYKAALEKEKSIRNPTAFIASIIRRLIENSARRKTFEDLPESVRDGLESIFQEGNLSKEVFIEKCLESMHCLTDLSMEEVVKKYKEHDQSAIQRPEGFMSSIIRRLSNIERRGSNGQPPSEVKARISEAIEQGKLKEGELDERCMEALAEFDARTGLEILDQLFASDLATVRNMGGFFFGIVKRYKSKKDRDRRGGGRRGGGRRDRGRDRYDDYDRRRDSSRDRYSRRDDYRRDDYRRDDYRRDDYRRDDYRRDDYRRDDYRRDDYRRDDYRRDDYRRDDYRRDDYRRDYPPSGGYKEDPPSYGR